MADLYRKSLIDRLSNPDQLDKMIKISSPISWLALTAILLVIVATIVWSIAGVLPTTETVSGVITGSDNICAVYSDTAATVEKFYKKVGDDVAVGDSIAEIKQPNGLKKTIAADKAGKLSVLSVELGMPVLAGTELARISPVSAGKQVMVCYVPLVISQKFREGMKVSVYPLAVDSQKYGHMEAKIFHVEEYAVNTNSLTYVLGSGNLVAEQFVANGPVVAVVCKLKTDASTKSGFWWSSESGKNLTISNGSIASAKIVVDECAPITKLIGKIKNGMEG